MLTVGEAKLNARFPLARFTFAAPQKDLTVRVNGGAGAFRLRDVGEASTWAKHDWWTERSHYSELVEDFHQRARVHLGAKPLGKSLEWGPASRPTSLPAPGGTPEPSGADGAGEAASASQETARSSS